jgi:hypothetical protein
MSKSYSMNMSEDKQQSEQWNFPILQEVLKTSRGISTGIHAVIREDSGEMIGQYSDEKAISYAKISSSFEAGLIKLGFEVQKNAFVTGNGSRFFANYSLDMEKIAGESFSCNVRLQAAHDGSLKRGFSFFMKRLACLNGMMITSEVFSIYKKASMNFDLSFLENNIQNAIDGGKSHVKGSIEKMLQIPLETSQVEKIASNLVTLGKFKGVTERAGLFMVHNWNNPSADEMPLGNNLYRLYNAATRWTRDIENKQRFEMANKANVFISGAFDLASRRVTDLDKLLAIPVESLDFAGTEIVLN